MQKNMKTRVHQAKVGKPPWMAEMMELTKAMIHASCHARLASALRGARWAETHNAYRDGGQGERVANDAADGEGLASTAVAVAVFHFAD